MSGFVGLHGQDEQSVDEYFESFKVCITHLGVSIDSEIARMIFYIGLSDNSKDKIPDGDFLPVSEMLKLLREHNTTM